MIPGLNLLDVALSVIAPQDVMILRCTGRTVNSAGNFVSTYAAAAPLKASVQAVPRSEYQYLGLDLQKNYAKMYASADTQDVGRDRSGDQFTWAGRKWQAESNTDWYQQDGWKATLLIDIGAAT